MTREERIAAIAEVVRLAERVTLPPSLPGADEIAPALDALKGAMIRCGMRPQHVRRMDWGKLISRFLEES